MMIACINVCYDSVILFSTRCSDAYSDTMLGYANSIRTVDGGTHIDGTKASLTRTLNNLGKKSKIIKVHLSTLLSSVKGSSPSLPTSDCFPLSPSCGGDLINY